MDGFVARFTALWFEAMGLPEYRLPFEAFFGGLWGLFGWWVLDRQFRGAPKIVKSWFPFIVGGVGVPVAIVLAALISGISYQELAAMFNGVGGLTSKAAHDFAGRHSSGDGEDGEPAAPLADRLPFFRKVPDKVDP